MDEFLFSYVIESVNPTDATAVINYIPQNSDLHSIRLNVRITNATDATAVEADIKASAPLELWRRQKDNHILDLQKLVGTKGKATVVAAPAPVITPAFSDNQSLDELRKKLKG